MCNFILSYKISIVSTWIIIVINRDGIICICNFLFKYSLMTNRLKKVGETTRNHESVLYSNRQTSNDPEKKEEKNEYTVVFC